MESSRTIKLVLATKENLKPYGFFISEQIDAKNSIGIPFYKSAIEGGNINATWKDQACVRMSQIHWRDDHNITWMERHLEMTQAFIVVGHNPGLFVLGKPTHERDDLDEAGRKLPDVNDVKGFIIPAGNGVILHLGTWHDFPVSCGPPVTSFVINTEEVVAALVACESPRPMDEGDCFKIKLSDHFDFRMKFPDPRPFVQELGLLQRCAELHTVMGEEGYGSMMKRKEVAHGWARGESVYVIPVINVEIFKQGCGGPGIQPHLKSSPEIANKGWRDYGNLRGLQRLSQLFRSLGIPATAVVNSDASFNRQVRDVLVESGWELGAHGANNSEGNAGMTKKEEWFLFTRCIQDLKQNLGVKPKTWLTPGFSVTERTASISMEVGMEVILDFVDDDVPYWLEKPSSGGKILCIPYCLETNDFSLVLTKNFDGRQYAQALEDHVRQLAKERNESVVCLGMHTFVAGTPARVNALFEMFERLKHVKGVKFATAAEVYSAVNNTKQWKL